MNTFLPSPDFGVCAFVLDRVRLNKQLVEGIQLCKLIAHIQEHPSVPRGFSNHPVLKLWQSADGHWLLPELVRYLDTLSMEWHRRPGRRKRHRWEYYAMSWCTPEVRTIIWPEHVHEAMRRNLLRKDPTHYQHYFRLAGLPIGDPMEGYFWEHPRVV